MYATHRFFHRSVRQNFKPSDRVSPNQQRHPTNSRTIVFFFTSQPIPLFYSPTRKNPNALGNAHALFKKTNTQKDKYSKNPQAAAKPSAPVRCVTPVSESSPYHDGVSLTIGNIICSEWRRGMKIALNGHQARDINSTRRHKAAHGQTVEPSTMAYAAHCRQRHYNAGCRSCRLGINYTAGSPRIIGNGVHERAS